MTTSNKPPVHRIGPVKLAVSKQTFWAFVFGTFALAAIAFFGQGMLDEMFFQIDEAKDRIFSR